jgi:aldose 1-epimerase
VSEVLLSNERVQLGFCPEVGVSLTRFQFSPKSGGTINLFPDVLFPLSSSSSSASFLMAPYSNRIRDGKFSFGQSTYQLSLGEKHAIHGDVRNRSWSPREISEVRGVFELDAERCPDFNFPFPAVYECQIELLDSGFRQSLLIENRGTEMMPVGGGFHPYFRRELLSGEVPQLCFRARGSYESESEVPLPTGVIRDLTQFNDYGTLKELCSGHDDCFFGWDGEAILYWPEAGIRLHIEASNNCQHVILYSPVDSDRFAFEPASHCIDSFNLYAQGYDQTGMQILEPGQSLTMWWQVRCEEDI